MRFRIVLIFAALLGFYLQWDHHFTAGLSANAYDLAEWVSVSPLAKMTTPQMTTPLFLRLVLAGVALLFAIHARQPGPKAAQVALGLLALVLAFTLQPPLGFFTAARDDVNYRQLFVLSIVTGIAVLAIFSLPRFMRLSPQTFLKGGSILALGLAISGILGLTGAFDILQRTGAPTAPGIGFFLTEGALVLYGISGLIRQKSAPPIPSRAS